MKYGENIFMERFAKMWWSSRADANVSQEYIANELGVSKKTIQNWERGVSSPTFFQGFEWFKVIGLNPYRYCMEYMFPDLFVAKREADEEELERRIAIVVKQMSKKEKEELLYLMLGKHGSSWNSLLQMFNAHCHSSMRSRVITAEVILNNYIMEQSLGATICDDIAPPDTEMLKSSIDKGRTAVFNNEHGYSANEVNGGK